jgi:hypothetical protein
MATGRLATFQVGSSNTTLYTVPTGYYAIANVSITNQNASSITLKLAMASTTSPTASEWIEWNTVIPGNGVFERTGLVLNAGLNVIGVSSNATGVYATVYGIETSTT